MHMVPAAQRDKWPLVVTDDHLVWVPGVRVDQRAAIDETKRDTVFDSLLLAQRVMVSKRIKVRSRLMQTDD